jgi:hypothetical protein
MLLQMKSEVILGHRRMLDVLPLHAHSQPLVSRLGLGHRLASVVEGILKLV